jgi:threonine/homoserine/homoserine lactone efflux protein
MFAITNLFIALVFSFIGSIPPGAINLTVVQLGLENKTRIALRFAVAAALTEYPYAWIAVKFERLITSTPLILENIRLAGAIIMLVIGVINLWPKGATPSPYAIKLAESGYRRGFILGLLNPLASPYWIAWTAVLRANGWIAFPSQISLQSYLIGVVIGAFLILLLFAYLGKKVMSLFQSNRWIQKIPGITLIAMGIYSLVLYFFP